MIRSIVIAAALCLLPSFAEACPPALSLQQLQLQQSTCGQSLQLGGYSQQLGLTQSYSAGFAPFLIASDNRRFNGGFEFQGNRGFGFAFQDNRSRGFQFQHRR